MKKRILSVAFVILILQILIINGISVFANDYPSTWAEEEVKNAVDNNLVPLSLQLNYGESITRVQFCSIAVTVYEKITGKEIIEHREFSDTEDIDVEKMGGLSIVLGVGENTFNPNDLITREQAAIILVRLLNKLGVNLESSYHEFTDQNTISDWAIDYVNRISNTGIMLGDTEHNFLPKSNFTVEQSIITLLRVYNKVEECEVTEESVIDRYTREVLDLLNVLREENGLNPLKTATILHSSAVIRATELETLYSHTRPSEQAWSTIFLDMGVRYKKVGENLAMGYKTPEEAIEAWWNSEGHRRNMLDPDWTQVGIGVHQDESGTLYWSQLFIKGMEIIN